MIEADYLVVGAGTMGLAFADSILTETDATIAIVDRYGKPGGHWTRAYPFVRLHQPSAFYGVNSRPLGSGKKDTHGGNAGLYELASGAEVVAYFDQLMNQQFLPSGRVQYFPLSEYAEGGVIASLASGEKTPVKAKKVVDATYSQVSVPSMRPPLFDVEEGVTCVAPNALTTIDHAPDGYVVIGAGKTGMDACLWLLDNGVDPDKIAWIVPRDSWMLDRATIQPGAEFFEKTVGGFALQLEASAVSKSVNELFERLDDTGQLLRLDKNVRPTMYRCSTVSQAELEQVRSIENIVRLGRVQSISTTAITLDNGTFPTTKDTLHIDCTADGLARRPVAPVFAGDRITMQNIRTCQPAFSSGLIGHVEAAYEDESEKNEICSPNPYPDSDLDYLPMTHSDRINTARWASDSALTTWIQGSRLDAYSLALRMDGPPTDKQTKILGKIAEYSQAAIENLPRLIEQIRN